MSQELIEVVFSQLILDEIFMAYFALTPLPPAEKVVNRIVKGLEIDSTFIRENIPQVQIYVMPGRFGRNPLVFEGKFCLDFYAKSSVDARKMAGRVFKILHDKNLRSEIVNTFRCSLTYDTDFGTGITGVKAYKAIYDVDYIRMN
ncbi:hypothetical protein [Paenibacillus endoradicis]|uniref:hypothetical protein n=1 Tax=Paenibacillus endoradicis TaxID=2972487 RepID=UPI002158A84D|nr:hypothetical protein [Paenibacillus endoradicis]MCR8656933.1 hypothetical protein [Paenibacillus endoradicis]